MEQKEVFDLCLTGIIAVVTLYIAIMQYMIQRYRVRIDLFERRMKVYEAVRDVLSATMFDNLNEKLFSKEFDSAVTVGRFVFDKKLGTYLLDIKENALKLHNYKRELGLPGLSENRREFVAKEEYELNLWFQEQRKIFESRFVDFMALRKL